jgi:hypothetical protein
MQREVTIEELEIGETAQVSPRVVVERRCFLKTLAVGFGALSIRGVATAPISPGAMSD